MRRALWENMDQVLEQLNMFNQEIIIYRIRTSRDMTHIIWVIWVMVELINGI